MTQYRSGTTYRANIAWDGVNGPQTVFVPGADFGSIGNSFISFALRTVYPSGLNVSVLGAQSVSFKDRTLDLAGNSIQANAFGTPFIAYRVRTVYPNWIVGLRIGNHVVDRTHYVTGSGWDSSIVQPPDNVGKPRQRSDAHGWNSFALGALTVKNQRQIVHPDGVLGTLPGDFNPSRRVRVYNKRQYIAQLNVRDFYDGGYVSYLLSVLNKNRFQYPSGWNSNTNKFGRASVRNNAVVYSMNGFSATLWGRGQIAFRIRTFNIPGISSLHIENYGTVVYKTPELHASGFLTSRVGIPSIVNTRRYFGFNGFQASAIGHPFVAFRVRTLNAFMPDQTAYGRARASHNPQDIHTSGDHFDRFGNVSSAVILLQMWPNPVAPNQRFGATSIHNVTPELHPYGIPGPTFGTTKVRTQWRKVYPSATVFTRPGLPIVAYRTQHVAPLGTLSFRLPATHRIQKVSPDPPGPQTVVPFGVGPPSIATHSVRTNEVQPNGLLATLFGAGRAELRGMHVAGISPPYDPLTASQMGTPSLNPTQVATPHWTAITTIPGPRMSPHYIWAPFGYPFGDYSPNEGEFGHPIDRYTDGFDGANWPTAFGTSFVSLKNRKVFLEGFISSSSGNARISTNPQYIFAHGFKAFKYGIPSLNGGGEVDTVGFVNDSIGDHSLTHSRPNPWPINPPAVAVGSIGSHSVDFKNRTRHMIGIDSFTTSPPGPFPPASYLNKNYTVVTHAYLPFDMSVGNALLFGSHMISFRIRYLNTEGDDMSTVCNDTPGQFDGAMKVIGRATPRTIGFDASRVGQPAVRYRRATIQPAGIWQSYLGRAGVRYSRTVSASGFDAQAFGDPWRVIPGEAQVRGAIWTVFGNPQLNQRKHLGALDFSAIGAARVAHSIAPAGGARTQFGAPSVVRSGGACP